MRRDQRYREIKKWFIDAGLTQSEVARKLGLTQSTIYQVIKGNAKSQRVVQMLSDLGCPKEYLEEAA